MRKLVLALAIALSLAAPPLTTRADFYSMAPADRYFGHMKMSVLGIRNSIRDLTLRIEAYPGDAPSVYRKAALVEDALHDWQRKFPRDPWIPRMAFQLAELYNKIDGDDAHESAQRAYAWLAERYPGSEESSYQR